MSVERQNSILLLVVIVLLVVLLLRPQAGRYQARFNEMDEVSMEAFDTAKGKICFTQSATFDPKPENPIQRCGK